MALIFPAHSQVNGVPAPDLPSAVFRSCRPRAVVIEFPDYGQIQYVLRETGDWKEHCHSKELRRSKQVFMGPNAGGEPEIVHSIMLQRQRPDRENRCSGVAVRQLGGLGRKGQRR